MRKLAAVFCVSILLFEVFTPAFAWDEDDDGEDRRRIICRPGICQRLCRRRGQNGKCVRGICLCIPPKQKPPPTAIPPTEIPQTASPPTATPSTQSDDVDYDDGVDDSCPDVYSCFRTCRNRGFRTGVCGGWYRNTCTCMY